MCRGGGVGQQEFVEGVGDDDGVGDAVDHGLALLAALGVGEAELDFEIFLLHLEGFGACGEFFDAIADGAWRRA